MRRWANVGLLLAHRLRRWPNSKPTLAQRLTFAGLLDTEQSWPFTICLKNPVRGDRLRTELRRFLFDQYFLFCLIVHISILTNALTWGFNSV